MLFSIVPLAAAIAWMASDVSRVLAWTFGAALLLVAFWTSRLVIERLRRFKCRVLVTFDIGWGDVVTSPVFPGKWLRSELILQNSGLLLASEFRRLDQLLVSVGETPLSKFAIAAEHIEDESAYSDASVGMQSLRRLLKDLTERDEAKPIVERMVFVLNEAAERGARFALVVIDDHDYLHNLFGRAGTTKS